MLKLDWVKCSPNNSWCSLQGLNLESVGEHAYGVYMIWYSAPADAPYKSAVVRVGQGYIRDRVQKHRKDRKITQYSTRGKLLVTWALVQLDLCDGVERYLATTWQPLVGDRYPDVEPIEVNSPFA